MDHPTLTNHFVMIVFFCLPRLDDDRFSSRDEWDVIEGIRQSPVVTSQRILVDFVNLCPCDAILELF